MKLTPEAPHKFATQHNNLIRASYKFGVLESRIFTLLISYIHKEDNDIGEIKVPVSKIVGDTTSNTSGRYYSLITEACDKMMKMQLNAIPIEERNKRYRKINFFDEINYEKGRGYITAKFGSSIKPYLIDLKGNFTTSEVEQVLKLKSGYAHRMYWILMSIRKMHTPQMFAVEELRFILLGGEDKYPTYGELKKHVFTPAFNEVKELNDNNLDFEVEEKKTGRAVTHLKFIFNNSHHENKQTQVPTQLKQLSSGAAQPDQLTEQEQNCYTRMIKLTLSDAQARNILNNIPHKDIHSTCYQLELWYLDNKDKNIGAYAYKTFKEKYNL
jgi:plasmid replication initiation protein